jgi:hypothetical protein
MITNNQPTPVPPSHSPRSGWVEDPPVLKGRIDGASSRQNPHHHDITPKYPKRPYFKRNSVALEFETARRDRTRSPPEPTSKTPRKKGPESFQELA